jgi:hypothetical protein
MRTIIIPWPQSLTSHTPAHTLGDDEFCNQAILAIPKSTAMVSGLRGNWLYYAEYSSNDVVTAVASNIQSAPEKLLQRALTIAAIRGLL